MRTACYALRMAVFPPQTHKSRLGNEVTIRSAVVSDASAILPLSVEVIDEVLYQITTPAEFKTEKAAEEEWIAKFEQDHSKIILVAEMNSKLVGLLDFSNGRRVRIAHTGEFGMSVEKTSRGQGIGEMLLRALIEWATANETIEKIGLTVHANNARAIALYKKMGFEIEGIRKREIKYDDGEYIDTVVMGRFV